MSENGHDPDGPQNGDGRYCRDFIRNVCNRGKNCKFIHPENAKIRTEPLFCHDFQQQKCFRGSCKFIHCSREEEDHYKTTGELPDAAINTEYYDETRMRNGPNARKPAMPSSNARPNGNGAMSNRNGPPQRRSNGANDDVPLCKDHLKGLCDRPPGGCKFRHASPTEGYGAPSNAATAAKRRVANTNYYDSGPEAKRNHYSTDYDDFNGTTSYNPPPPPPPPQQHHQGYSSTGYSSTSYYDTGSLIGQSHTANNVVGAASAFAARNGYLSTAAAHGLADVSPFGSASTGTVAAMKALEEENIFLKRRVEEYKKQVNDLVATNEYLLSQNAHFRLNTLKDQAAASGGVTLVSMAQPIVMNPSLSVAATQPLSTISSLPTVSMTPVSISQSLPVVSMAGHHPSQAQTVFPLVTTQGVLPQN